MKLPRLHMPSMQTTFALLDVAKFTLLVFLFLMFIHFNAAIASNSEQTQRIARSTNGIVKQQDDILKAIKQVTEDTKITAAQQTAIIICMLQVPVDQRTTDLQAQCKKEFSNEAAVQNDVGAAGSGAGTGQSSSGINPLGSSSNSTTPTTSSQSNNSQSPPDPTPQPSLLDRIIAPISRLLNAF